MPRPWQSAVAEAEKESTAELSETLDSAVTAVDIKPQTPGWWSVAKFLQIIFFIATILGLLGVIATAILAFVVPGALPGWSWALSIGLLVIGIIGSIVTSLIAKSARSKGADEAASDVDRKLRDAVGSAAQSSYLEPVNAVIDEHRRAYETLR